MNIGFSLYVWRERYIIKPEGKEWTSFCQILFVFIFDFVKKITKIRQGKTKHT